MNSALNPEDRPRGVDDDHPRAAEHVRDCRAQVADPNIMFSPMWMMPACSHPALSTVHHMPSMNLGPAPLAPSIRLMVGWADSMPNGLPPPMMLAAKEQGQQQTDDVEGAAPVDDQRNESEVVAEISQERARSPTDPDFVGDHSCNTVRR